MKGKQKNSLLSRLLRRKRAASRPGEAPVDDGVPPKLSGTALEQAYRDLLLENQVLVESNVRLHDRLTQREEGQEESPATRELIRAQRNALAERSHRLRELEYEARQQQREHRKLLDDNKRLLASLAQLKQEAAALQHKEAEARRAVADARAELREKQNELATLTDRYYQLEARAKQPNAASGRV